MYRTGIQLVRVTGKETIAKLSGLTTGHLPANESSAGKIPTANSEIHLGVKFLSVAEKSIRKSYATVIRP